MTYITYGNYLGFEMSISFRKKKSQFLSEKNLATLLYVCVCMCSKKYYSPVLM